MRTIVGAFVLGLVLSVQAQQTYVGQPSDDVWFYDNAFNPGFTPILRVWGTRHSAIDPTGAFPALNYSYSLARWDLRSLRAGVRYQVLSARITVVQTTPPGYTQQEGIDYPLEARNLSHANFTEAGWNYNDPTNPLPGSVIFGTGTMVNYNPSTPFAIPIALTNRSEFEDYFNQVVNGSGYLGIGFTSRLDPEGQGGTRIYRFYSRNDGGGRGPVLEVVYRVAGDVNGDGCTDDADLLEVLFNFGQTGSSSTDLNQDGVVDDADLLEVLFQFGNGC